MGSVVIQCDVFMRADNSARQGPSHGIRGGHVFQICCKFHLISGTFGSNINQVDVHRRTVGGAHRYGDGKGIADTQQTYGWRDRIDDGLVHIRRVVKRAVDVGLMVPGCGTAHARRHSGHTPSITHSFGYCAVGAVHGNHMELRTNTYRPIGHIADVDILRLGGEQDARHRVGTTGGIGDGNIVGLREEVGDSIGTFRLGAAIAGRGGGAPIHHEGRGASRPSGIDTSHLVAVGLDRSGRKQKLDRLTDGLLVAYETAIHIHHFYGVGTCSKVCIGIVSSCLRRFQRAIQIVFQIARNAGAITRIQNNRAVIVGVLRTGGTVVTGDIVRSNAVDDRQRIDDDGDGDSFFRTAVFILRAYLEAIGTRRHRGTGDGAAGEFNAFRQTALHNLDFGGISIAERDVLDRITCTASLCKSACSVCQRGQSVNRNVTNLRYLRALSILGRHHIVGGD